MPLSGSSKRPCENSVVNGFVLAGGLSTRMGRDKALLPIGERPLVLRAIESLRGLNLSPRICGSRSDLARFAPVIPDNYPGSGPLAGIQAALATSDAELNLFLPVDMPSVPLEFLRWMIARAEISGSVAIIPSFADRPQPLCAVYRRHLEEGLRAALESGNRKVMLAIHEAASSIGENIDLFQVESVAAALRAGEWPCCPPLRHWFRNLNTPADLRIASEAASHSAPGANGSNPIS